MADLTPEQHVYVTFFDQNEMMPYQTFGPYEWADLEGMAIRAMPMVTADEPHPDAVYVASYNVEGTPWSDDLGEGWKPRLGDDRFRYTDVSIGTAPTRIPYSSPTLTDDQIRRVNDNDPEVRESVQEEL